MKNKLFQFLKLNKLYNNMPQKIFDSANLYHFTTFDSALKILLSNTLLFGKYRDMNDINESIRMLYADIDEKDLDQKQDEFEKYQQLSFTMDINSKNKGFELSTMWGHYADKGRGVCLVFDKEILINNLPKDAVHRKVEYSEDVSNWRYLGDEDIINEIFFKKFIDWGYENEYRIILKSNSEQRVKLEFKDSLKGIIILFDGDNTKMLEKLNLKIPIFHYTCLVGQYSLTSTQERYTKHDKWEDIEGYEPVI